MTSLLLIISFLLHIIALVAIYLLFQQVHVKQKENTSSEEVTEVLESYLEEIKAENDRLQNMLNEEEQKNSQMKEVKTEQPMNKKISQSNEKKQADEELHELDELLNNLPGDDVDTSLESRVLQLYSTGMDIDHIAKQLDCGKTEAELIIKFHHMQ